MINVQQTDQKAIFSGALTRATITRAFDKEYRKLVDNKRVVLDLAHVSQIDTAGLAWILLLIELMGHHLSNDIITYSISRCVQ